MLRCDMAAAGSDRYSWIVIGIFSVTILLLFGYEHSSGRLRAQLQPQSRDATSRYVERQNDVKRGDAATNSSILLHTDDTQNEESLESPPDNFICSQEQRMRLLQERCRESGVEANIDNLTDQVLKYRFRQLTVSDKLKIITCVHYKVAWSSINCVTVKNSVASPVSDCNNAYKIKKDHLRYLSSYNASEIRYRLKQYYKFMFVRHPFDRILSAWRDKLLIEMDQLYGHWGNYYRQWMPKILECIHPDWNVTRPDQLDKIRLPFADIVRWLQAGGYDMHTHGPYEDWCHPCQIQYDYIGKVETFDQDMNFIIDKKMKGRGKNTKNNVWDEHKNPAHFPFSKALKEYRNVTLDMLHFLSTKYQKDFEQFGYSWKLDEKTRDVVAECSGDCC